MNCAELEILLCDYVDGTLAPAEKAVVERHLAECPACAELAGDGAAAVAFIETAEEVEPPPELITRMLFEAPWTKAKSKSKLRTWIGAIFSPILQPKFAMGMAMTVISLSVLVKPVRQLQLADLEPKKVWTGIEYRAGRAWDRTVKFYLNLKLVYQIQNTLHEWQQQDEDRRPAADHGNSDHKTDDRKLPVAPAPHPEGTQGAAAPGGAPL